jgi:uncharacterized protein (TIGR02453 family)
MAFSGLPVDGIEFYEQLAADNSKVFWQENKQRYAEHVKAPMAELAEELDEYGPFHMFRPHNDMRFSKNKPPYKIHQGAYGELEAGSGHYFQFSAEGLMTGAGYYAMAKDQLKRFREVIDAENTGEEIAGIITEMRKAKYEITAIDELKTAPRGYPKDHPRVELLRMKGCIAVKNFGAPKWIQGKGAAKRVRDVWVGALPLTDWLDAHVGPSTLPPDDRPF